MLTHVEYTYIYENGKKQFKKTKIKSRRKKRKAQHISKFQNVNTRGIYQNGRINEKQIKKY